MPHTPDELATVSFGLFVLIVTLVGMVILTAILVSFMSFIGLIPAGFFWVKYIQWLRSKMEKQG